MPGRSIGIDCSNSNPFTLGKKLGGKSPQFSVRSERKFVIRE